LDNYKKVVLASSNTGKIKELTTLLQPFNIELIPQSALGIPDAEETGLTFIENALLKARHAALLSGLPALSDDSGLAVTALNGAPGIYSARYAGEPSNASLNIDKLLKDMHDVPDDKRQAAFHCVLAFMTSATDPAPIVCDGKWKGMLLRQRHGEHGFGYDPIFFVPSENKSAAELPSEIKNKLSHRAKALQSLIELLADKI